MQSENDRSRFIQLLDSVLLWRALFARTEMGMLLG